MLKSLLLSIIPQAIKDRYSQGAIRSKETLKNVIVSFLMKGASLVASFMIVPLTIDYVNPTQYGIWMSISSIVGWFTFFNLGLGNGFRNRFAEAVANNDPVLARQYVSTTYFAITVVATFILIIISLVNLFVDWAQVLKVDSSYSEELQRVVQILGLFFCVNLVVSIFDSLLLADQKSRISSIIHVLGQVFSLISLVLLTKFTTGSLTYLALFYTSIPCLLSLLISVFFFGFTRYKTYCPSIKQIKPRLIKTVLQLGVQFFFINICLLLIFQIINVVISREVGPRAVTEYNIAYKYFGVLYTIMAVLITPFWSAFTDAYTKKDFAWMKKTIRALEIGWGVGILLGLLMLAVSGPFYRFWVKDAVVVRLSVSISLMVYMLAQTISSMYTQLINGIGTIRIQLIIYIVFAIVSWPLVTYSCRCFGICGAVVAPVLVFVTQAIFGKIQLSKILNNQAEGIWIQ